MSTAKIIKHYCFFNDNNNKLYQLVMLFLFANLKLLRIPTKYQSNDNNEEPDKVFTVVFFLLFYSIHKSNEAIETCCLHFKLDWASLVVGSKFTVFALFYLVFEGNFPSTSPRGAYIWRGDLTEGFLRYRFGGLIFGGACTWRGLFSEFYGI